MYKSLFFLITVSIISCQGPQDAAEVLAEVEKEKEKTSTETATAEKQQDKIIEFSGGSLAVPPGSSVTAEVTESTALILDLSGVAFASAADSAVKVSGVTESETGVKMSLAIPDENLTLTASSPLAGVVRVDLSTRKIEVLSLAELTHRTGFVDFTDFSQESPFLKIFDLGRG